MEPLHKLPVSRLLNALKTHPDFPQSGPVTDAELVIQATLAAFSVTRSDLLSSSKEPSIARPRIFAMATLYELGQNSKISLAQVGRVFGNRDHGAVIHARRRLPQLCRRCSHFAATVQTLRDALGLPPISSQISVKTLI